MGVSRRFFVSPSFQWNKLCRTIIFFAFKIAAATRKVALSWIGYKNNRKKVRQPGFLPFYTLGRKPGAVVAARAKSRKIVPGCRNICVREQHIFGREQTTTIASLLWVVWSISDIYLNQEAPYNVLLLVYWTHVCWSSEQVTRRRCLLCVDCQNKYKRSISCHKHHT